MCNLISTIKSFKDNRGELKFINFVSPENKNKSLQQFISINKKGVIRGIHVSPYGKTITCLKGYIEDYIINLQTLTYSSIMLKENDQIYIPPNFGHCFLSLQDDTHILYQLEGQYIEENEINIHYLDPYINLPFKMYEIDTYILSDKDKNNSFIKPIDYIVLGGDGFLGSNICKILEKQKKNYIKLNTRFECIEIISTLFQLYKPKYVINAAGISGKPTVAWCENNKELTLKVNYHLQLNIIRLCMRLNIHLTILGSGMIFKNNKVYTENDKGDLHNIYYSKVRIMLEEEVNNYISTTDCKLLYLRIIYPISGDGHEKCFLTKLLTRLDSIHDKYINVTTIPLFNLLPNLIENNEIGIFNFVNKDKIKLENILEIYKNKKDKDLKWITVSSDLNNNNPNLILEPILDTTKLEKKYKLENIKKELENLFN
jgi:dTDP-4-dehydrorhamnose 3,5-epimerase